LAGLSGTSRLRFLAFDAVGISLWSCVYAGLGYTLSRDLNRAAAYTVRMGQLFAFITLAAIGVYVARKLARWCRFIREFRLARITPEELKQKLDGGEEVLLVDLQGRAHPAQAYRAIPGAVRIDPRKLERYRAFDRATPDPVPRDREVVLYGDTPYEFTSARVALAMQGQGFRRVRPLAGGIRSWQERGFPVAHDLPLWVPKLGEKRGEAQHVSVPSPNQQI